MRILDQINAAEKYDIYYLYNRIIPLEEIVDYKKISKKKIVEQIHQYYKRDYLNICSLLTIRERDVLTKLLNDEEVNEFDCRWQLRNLYEKFITVYDENAGKYVVDETLKDYLKKAIKNSDWKTLKQSVAIAERVVGFMKCMGYLRSVALVHFMTAYFDIDEETAIEFMATNPLFRYYVIDGIQSNETDEVFDVSIYADYLDLFDELKEGKSRCGAVALSEIDDFILGRAFYEDLDETNPSVKAVMQLAREKNYPMIPKLLIETATLVEDFSESIPYISSALGKKGDEVFAKQIIDTIESINSSQFNGLTKAQHDKLMAENSKMTLKRALTYQQQVNAHIGQEASARFIEQYMDLLWCCQDMFPIEQLDVMMENEDIPPELFHDLVNNLWDNIDEVVDKYLEDNKQYLSKDEEKMIKKFKKGIHGPFIIVQYEQSYTQLLGPNEKVYMVKGLDQNIDKIIPVNELPLTVETSVIPFENNLIIDGLVNEYTIRMNVDMLKEIDENLDSFKKVYKL